MFEHLASARYGSPAKRFYEGFIPEPNSGCWLWEGGAALLSEDDYPRFRYGGRRERVHRFSYRLHKGPIPGEMQVLHRCDVSCCVNPDHLFLGTAVDNVADKVQKGRQARGTGHPLTKLTEANVIQIRALAGKFSNRELGRRFGVRHGIIGSIIRRKNWKHI